MSETGTQADKNVEVMLGNPKKALIAMAVPVMIANLVQSINNIIDTVWLTSLGVNAQAAVNVCFPIFFLVIGIGNGVAVGASQALARRIGAMDRKGANAAASQAFVITLVLGIVISIIFTVFADPLLRAGGASSNMEASLAYSIPIFMGIPLFLLGGLLSGLLRSEGAAKRSMNIHVAGAALNMVLDPIFIFVFGWGITGAAVATVIAMGLPLIVAFFWYFGRKDTFVRIPLKGFKLDKAIDWDILRVGIPASFEIVLMAIVAMIMNVIIDGVSPVDGIAIYGNGWKLVDLFMLPTMAIGFAIVPICAAALGAKKPNKIKEVYYLAMKYGVIISVVIAAILILFANYLVIPFSYSEATQGLAGQMAYFVMICGLFLPFCPLGYTSAGLFQSLGWGYKSLLISAVVNFIRLPICIYLAGAFGTLDAIWYGVLIAEIVGSLFGGVYGITSIRKLVRGGYPKLLPKDEFVFE